MMFILDYTTYKPSDSFNKSLKHELLYKLFQIRNISLIVGFGRNNILSILDMQLSSTYRSFKYCSSVIPLSIMFVASALPI